MAACKARRAKALLREAEENKPKGPAQTGGKPAETPFAAAFKFADDDEEGCLMEGLYLKRRRPTRRFAIVQDRPRARAKQPDAARSPATPAPAKSTLTPVGEELAGVARRVLDGYG